MGLNYLDTEKKMAGEREGEKATPSERRSLRECWAEAVTSGRRRMARKPGGTCLTWRSCKS